METPIKFHRYQSYKDSWIDWIGTIPDHWKVERAKWLFYKKNRPITPEDDVVTAFRDGVVTLRSNRRTEGFTNAIQEHGYQGIRRGDLVIHAMDAFAGAIGVSDSDGKATPVYAVCVNRGEYYTNNYYYAYLLRYMSKTGFVEALATGIRERSTDFRYNDFAKLNLPIPPREEQDRIANFLDQKITKIDEAITKEQRLIELLKEHKAILINQAVAKGLDLNVSMSDSGVEWIGEIPKHWKIKKVKHVCMISPSKNMDGVKKSDRSTVTFLPMEKVGDQGSIDTSEKRLTKDVYDGFTYFAEGDVVIAKITPCFENGKGAVITNLGSKFGFGTTELYVLRPKDINGKFLFQRLNCKSFLIHGEKFMHGSAGQKRLPTNFISNYSIGVPPLQEQQEIVSYCNNVTLKFVDVINQKISLIEKLAEYKQVIISEVVTGKIRI